MKEHSSTSSAHQKMLQWVDFGFEADGYYRIECSGPKEHIWKDCDKPDSTDGDRLAGTFSFDSHQTLSSDLWQNFLIDYDRCSVLWTKTVPLGHLPPMSTINEAYAWT